MEKMFLYKEILHTNLEAHFMCVIQFSEGCAIIQTVRCQLITIVDLNHIKASQCEIPYKQSGNRSDFSESVLVPISRITSA